MGGAYALGAYVAVASQLSNIIASAAQSAIGSMGVSRSEPVRVFMSAVAALASERFEITGVLRVASASARIHVESLSIKLLVESATPKTRINE